MKKWAVILILALLVVFAVILYFQTESNNIRLNQIVHYKDGALLSTYSGNSDSGKIISERLSSYNFNKKNILKLVVANDVDRYELTLSEPIIVEGSEFKNLIIVDSAVGIGPIENAVWYSFDTHDIQP